MKNLRSWWINNKTFIKTSIILFILAALQMWYRFFKKI